MNSNPAGALKEEEDASHLCWSTTCFSPSSDVKDSDRPKRGPYSRKRTGVWHRPGRTRPARLAKWVQPGESAEGCPKDFLKICDPRNQLPEEEKLIPSK